MCCWWVARQRAVRQRVVGAGCTGVAWNPRETARVHWSVTRRSRRIASRCLASVGAA